MMNDFQEQVWSHYAAHARAMPWRSAPTFYHVLVSEIMLQQTQVQRVTPKFQAFIERFPTIADLAAAPLASVLEQWVGLGYNRRAKYLHDASQYVVTHGQPSTAKELALLPGVGKNTAAAMMNYVYNVATPFVETNIRTVYFNHFYAGQVDVTDTQIMDLVTKTMDMDNPREWFWALMDYGAYLKAHGLAQLTVSKHYKKQGTLMGSNRQMRGWIIKELAGGAITAVKLQRKYGRDPRYKAAVNGLKKDGLIIDVKGVVQLTK